MGPCCFFICIEPVFSQCVLTEQRNFFYRSFFQNSNDSAMRFIQLDILTKKDSSINLYNCF